MAGLSIVFVGLDEASVGVLQQYLRPHGHQLTATEGSEAAWALLKHDTAISVVVFDVGRLGTEHAVAMVQRIRSLPQSRYLYIMLIAGDGQDAEASAGVDAGADDLLSRPVQVPHLLARLKVAERILGLQRDLSGRNQVLTDINNRLQSVNDRMTKDLHSAARVQQSLLPTRDDPAPGLRVAFKVRPCEELAGDTLNVFRLDEHHLAFYLLDVSGHGVSSSLLSVQVSRLMSPMMSQSEVLKARLTEPPWYRVVSPADVAAKLNHLFPMKEEAPQYFTILYGLLRLATNELRFVSAGHPGPMLVRGDSVRAIPANGFPIGCFDDVTYEEHALKLERGDRLYLFSDGITEAQDPRRHLFGEEGLSATLAECRGQPLKVSLDTVLARVERWSAPQAVADDCSLLGIELA